MADILNYPYGEAQFEPTRKNLWLVDFEDTPLTAIAQTKLKFLARAASLPGMKREVIKDSFLNKDYNYGDKWKQDNDWKPKFLEVYDDVNAKAIIEEWMRLIYDPNTGAQNFLSTYKGNLKLHLLNLDYSVFKSYILYDAFPKDTSDVSLDTTEGKMEFDATFQYRYYKEI